MRKTMPQIHDYSSFVGCEAEHDVAGRRTMEVTGKTVRFSAMRFGGVDVYLNATLRLGGCSLEITDSKRDEVAAHAWCRRKRRCEGVSIGTLRDYGHVA